MQDQKNLILAILLSLGIFAAFHYFYQAPQLEKRRLAEAAHAQAIAAAKATNSAQNTAAKPAGAMPQAPSLSAGAATGKRMDLAIRSERVNGTLNLSGGMVDDLRLTTYFTKADGDEQVRLLEPARGDAPYYAQTGWVSADPAASGSMPDDKTGWTGSGTLTPTSPITLSWRNDKGLLFERQIALDDAYMFTITDTVKNTGDAAVALHPYALVSRHIPKLADYGLSAAHEGGVAVLNGDLHEEGFSSLYDDRDEPNSYSYSGVSGWLGLTDKYWLVAAIPPSDAKVRAKLLFSDAMGTRARFQADYMADALDIAPGGSASFTHRIFAGAKEVRVIDAYRDSGIDRFDLAIDFGWYYFMTKPLLYSLDYLGKHTGNFGIAILIITVVVKLLLYPLANKSYISMTKMKKLTPQMNALKERFGKDPQKLQGEVMALYKREGVNPLGGCLPIFIQIPVFFSLYKVLVISLEMRHAPFFGWIHDLSAPDPTTIFNLFGLIPWQPPQMLMIGILPLLMCATMVLQQKMQPPPTDPAQAKIMSLMPYVFSYMMAHFAAGLVVYWTWNNILSIAQQYVIMRRLGVSIRD